ncbi:MAG: carboxypeptidase-like regulatory domain-containing protein [Bacteroidetes bacterium]|nr:carboxypeptidase-like regulatory domain-containing protein [Bacteroidota bacterium]
MRRKILFFIVAVVICFSASAQKLLKGIVVDSATLNAVPSASVRIKGANWGTLTDAGGVFFIKVKPTDTLIFSSVGYFRTELPVYVDDEVMFVRLVQDVTLLKEVVVTGRPEAQKIESPTLKLKNKFMPWGGAVPSGGGAAVNLDFFSKREREKRKLEKLKSELSKTQTYVDIVTNPDVKQELMDRFSLSDTTFYKILTHFNEQHIEITHSGSQSYILNSLFSFFEAEVRLRRYHH